MKPFYSGCLTVCIGVLLLVTSDLQAQALSKGPARIAVDSRKLDQVFHRTQGPEVSVRLSPTFTINGIVSEQIKVDEALESINIRCRNFDNALLTLHRITERGQQPRYTGRIIDPQSKDVYVLVGEAEGYAFQKQPTHSLIAQ